MQIKNKMENFNGSIIKACFYPANYFKSSSTVFMDSNVKIGIPEKKPVNIPKETCFLVQELLEIYKNRLGYFKEDF